MFPPPNGKKVAPAAYDWPEVEGWISWMFQNSQKATPKKKQLQARKSLQNARRTLAQRGTQSQGQARWNNYNKQRGLQVNIQWW